MRDSGLDIAYALRQEAIDESVLHGVPLENGFEVGTYEALILQADLGGLT